MKKAINRIQLSGTVYDHNLTVKTVQNTESKNFGKEFINGTLDVATDPEGLNIVTVNFTYVTEMTSKGTKNSTYAALKTIIDGAKTILTDGIESAMMVKVDTALGLNDFYTDRNGQSELVSAKRCDGGFVTIVNKLPEEDKRNKFECDMLITNVTHVEADPERHIDADFVRVKGAVFNFRNAYLPVEFIVKNSGGMNYFESLDATPSTPVFTKVWGSINSQTIVDKREEESAFGESAVKEYERKVREWVITGAAKEPYELGDEQTSITGEELKQALADRETYLADVKRRQDEYQASKAAAAPASAPTGTTAAAGSFTF